MVSPDWEFEAEKWRQRAEDAEVEVVRLRRQSGENEGRGWTCGRCWIRRDEVQSVDVVPVAVLNDVRVLLEENPTAYAIDLAPEVARRIRGFDATPPLLTEED